MTPFRFASDLILNSMFMPLMTKARRGAYGPDERKSRIELE